MNEPELITGEAVKLPLWKTALEILVEEGIDYGSVIQSERLEDLLKCKRDSMKFSLSVSSMRKALLDDGFYLNGRGLDGDAFEIVRANQNVDVLEAKQAKSRELLKEAITLGVNTDRGRLSQAEAKLLDDQMELAAKRLVMIQRTQTSYRASFGDKPPLKALPKTASD